MVHEDGAGEKPRLPPVPPGEWSDQMVSAARAAFSARMVDLWVDTGAAPNVVGTMLHYPELARRFNGFGNLLLQAPALGHRARELMILRVAWLTRTDYEWVHHVHLGRSYGVDSDDVHAVMSGDYGRLAPVERDLVAATDQLLQNYRIDDATWQRLADRLDERQLAEIPFVVGAYTCLAMAFNSWGVRVEDGVDRSDVPTIDGT